VTARYNRLSTLIDRNFGRIAAAPAIAVLLAVSLFPLIYTIVVSFQNLTMLDSDTSFQGFMHYRAALFDTRLWAALGHTTLILVIALPLEIILGYVLARLFLEQLLGRQVFVALLVLPTVLSPIVAGATWRLMFDVRFGPVGQIVSWLVGEPVTMLWTVNPTLVYPAILICEVWQWTPFMFLLLLAALSNVDQGQLEAAELDGASGWRVFSKIILPAIRPVLVIAILIRGLDIFRIFDVIWVLTEGGPGTMTETLSIFTYQIGFVQFDTSYTAAISIMVVLALTIALTWALRRVEALK
jgi:multiple sugar transport system permease protein